MFDRHRPHIDSRPRGLRVCAVLLAGAAVWAGCGPGALDWVEEDGYRWAEVRVSGEDEPGFERLDPSETGISFENVVTQEQFIENSHYLNGSGVAVGDVDGDGRVDIYFAGMDGANELWRNLGGWKFEEIAEEAGVAAAGRFSTGAVFADVDGDGDLDLLVNALGGPNSLYLNDGTGHFTDGAEPAGLSSTLGSMSMTLADIEGDGDLDLYVVNNKVATVQDLFPPEVLQPRNIYRRTEDGFEVLPEWQEHYTLGEVQGGMVPRLELAEHDRLYLNDGTGRFSPVSFTDGAFLDEAGQPLTEAPQEWGLAARFQDMDGDGDPDLYVANDFHSPDHIWINDGSGRFRMLPPLAMRSTSFASMGVDFADVDRDERMDFFVVEMLSREQRLRMKQASGGVPDPQFAGRIENRPQKPRNTFYLNRGDGTWAEAAQYAGVDASGWSWGSTFVDVDLDGYEDLLIGTGHFYDAMDKDAAQRMGSVDWRQRLLVFPPLRLSNVAFRNRGDATFEEVGEAWGFAGEEDISHGMAAADLDEDGDLDIVTNRLLAPAGVYRNAGRGPRVAVRLRGRAPNTSGIGARIRVSGGELPPQTKEIVAGGAYLSGSEALASFAAGEGEMSVEVVWRSGATSRVDGVRANRVYEIDEPAVGGAAAAGAGSAAVGASDSEAASYNPLFEDVSGLLGHRHRENEFDDFAQQPLITWRLSQGGPGAAWGDVDGDGDADALVGGGGGSGLAVFRNDGAGGFSPDRGALGGGAAGPARAPGDQTGLVVVPGRAGAAVVVGTATYDGTDRAAPSASVLRATASGMGESQTLPAHASSTGPLAAADYDGDGDIDLFVGGRVVPGQYPVPATSRLFLDEGGRYVLDEANAGPLTDVGLVSGAVFSDVDADGDPDLILALEWGPLRLFLNEDGRFQDATASFGLESLTGWWNGVTAGRPQRGRAAGPHRHQPGAQLGVHGEFGASGHRLSRRPRQRWVPGRDRGALRRVHALDGPDPGTPHARRRSALPQGPDPGARALRAAGGRRDPGAAGRSPPDGRGDNARPHGLHQPGRVLRGLRPAAGGAVGAGLPRRRGGHGRGRARGCLPEPEPVRVPERGGPQRRGARPVAAGRWDGGAGAGPGTAFGHCGVRRAAGGGVRGLRRGRARGRARQPERRRDEAVPERGRPARAARPAARRPRQPGRHRRFDPAGVRRRDARSATRGPRRGWLLVAG